MGRQKVQERMMKGETDDRTEETQLPADPVLGAAGKVPGTRMVRQRDR